MNRVSLCSIGFEVEAFSGNEFSHDISAHCGIISKGSVSYHMVHIGGSSLSIGFRLFERAIRLMVILGRGDSHKIGNFVLGNKVCCSFNEVEFGRGVLVVVVGDIHHMRSSFDGIR